MILDGNWLENASVESKFLSVSKCPLWAVDYNNIVTRWRGYMEATDLFDILKDTQYT